MRSTTTSRERGSDMKAFKRRVTLGLVVASRAFFYAAYAPTARKELTEACDRLGVAHKILAFDETPNGAVESRQDALKCARFFRANRDEIDGIVVSLPNFGDEIAVVEAVAGAVLRV